MEYTYTSKNGPTPSQLQGTHTHNAVMAHVKRFLAWNETGATRRLKDDQSKIAYYSEHSPYTLTPADPAELFPPSNQPPSLLAGRLRKHYDRLTRHNGSVMTRKAFYDVLIATGHSARQFRDQKGEATYALSTADGDHYEIPKMVYEDLV